MHAPNVGREGLIPALEKRLAVADVIAIQNDVLNEHWDTITSLVPLPRLGGWVPNSTEDIKFCRNKGLQQITADEPTLALEAKTLHAKNPPASTQVSRSGHTFIHDIHRV